MADLLMLTIAAALSGKITAGDAAHQRKLEEVVLRKPETADALTEARENLGVWIEVLATRLEQAAAIDDEWANDLRDAWARLVSGSDAVVGVNNTHTGTVYGSITQAHTITGPLQF